MFTRQLEVNARADANTYFSLKLTYLFSAVYNLKYVPILPVMVNFTRVDNTLQSCANITRETLFL